MENAEQSSQEHKLRKPDILINPNKIDLKKALDMSKGAKILEIGCGEEPRPSWTIDKDDIWIGCDPAIINPRVIHVENDFPKEKLIIFDRKVEEIPPFKPDYFSVVAPNPLEIVKGEIFNDQLEKFLSDDKDQYFVIALDNRTHEAKRYRKEALETIREWMNEHGFKKYEPDEYIEYNFEPNSNDLDEESGMEYYVFAKFPQEQIY